MLKISEFEYRIICAALNWVEREKLHDYSTESICNLISALARQAAGQNYGETEGEFDIPLKSDIISRLVNEGKVGDIDLPDGWTIKNITLEKCEPTDLTGTPVIGLPHGTYTLRDILCHSSNISVHYTDAGQLDRKVEYTGPGWYSMTGDMLYKQGKFATYSRILIEEVG